jgi:tetratricopeptide (TPR) repeat protein
MKKFKIFIISLLLFYFSNILIWIIYTKNNLLELLLKSTITEAIASANERITSVDENIFNLWFNIGFGFGSKQQLIPILIIFSVYIFTLLNMSKLHWKWVDKNILNMFFLKIFVFFFVWFIGWVMGSFYNVVILELYPSSGINSFFLIVAPIVAYYVSFSEWANETIWKWVDENIWKWVDENILNMFSNNNSISTSERNEAIGYLKQGNNEYRNGRFNEAIKYYTKAIEIDSNFKEAYVNRDKARNKLL